MKKSSLLLIVLFAVAAGLFAYLQQTPLSEVADDDNSTSEIQTDQELQASPATPTSKELAQLSPAEFKQLFDSLALPNTRKLIEPPEITGDEAADTVIRSIAQKRGYQLQLIAQDNLGQINGMPAQQLIHGDWSELKRAAKLDGIELSIRSAHRTIAEQRSLFLQLLRQRGISNQMIVARNADEAIDNLLAIAAPPGYSRHHSGYTIDIADASAAVFEFSDGFAWISADNYANAKRYGFIPSYPEGLSNQGPNPEPWEYVWVNRDFVLE